MTDTVFAEPGHCYQGGEYMIRPGGDGLFGWLTGLKARACDRFVGHQPSIRRWFDEVAILACDRCGTISFEVLGGKGINSHAELREHTTDVMELLEVVLTELGLEMIWTREGQPTTETRRRRP